MGEAKRTAAHKPAPGMVNASGRQVKQLAVDLHDRITGEVNDKGMDLDVALGCAMAVVIDLLRVNAGDSEARRVITQTLDRRLEFPLEYWGGRAVK